MTTQQRQHRYPFAGLVDIVSDMSRMREAAHGEPPRREAEARSPVDAWIPAVDIAANDDHLVICAELSGVADEDVDVTYSPPVLTIAGERRLSDQDARGGMYAYYTKELNRGHFRRSITLPEECTRDDITVTLTRGLLTVTVQRRVQTDGSAALPLTTDNGER